jgi:hypothetical protein
MILREFIDVGNRQELDLMQAFKDFLPIAMSVLQINKLPRIKLEKDIKDSEQPTFGRFLENDSIIHLGIGNRHILDILRTLAHELVHFKQQTEHQLDDPRSGETGSPQENEANAVAGVIMRQFNKKYSHYFKTQPLTFNGLDETNKLIPYPKGTVKVDVDDVYDWYKLGMHISDLDDADPKDFGRGPPQTVISFGNEPLEHKYLKQLKRLGMKTHDIDEIKGSKK